MQMRLKELVGTVLVVLIAATACGSDAVVTGPDPTRVAETATPEAIQPAATASPTATEPTAVPAPTSTPVESPTADPAPTSPPVPTSRPDLPGEAFDLYVPETGEIVAVVGVAFDDILEVHAEPGENSPLLGTLPPVATDVVSVGEGRALPASIWWRVARGELDGWVGSRYVSRLGLTDDITAQIVSSLGSIPAAETMLDLGMIVANERASIDPPSSVVVSAAPMVGDLGEITIDVVGFPDDSVGGERLHIFGQPLDSGEGFSLKAVEATVMCSRGVTDDGFCL